MASAKDYLDKWRRLYSFPNYITGNSYLTEDGTICLDKEEDWDYAQRVAILKANAMGTYKNSYLDPIPLFNSLGDIYTNIINTSFESARTDSIKMNLLNMDFTNGGPKGKKNVVPYQFFNFYDYTSDEELQEKMFSDENKEALLKLFLEEQTTFALIEKDSVSHPTTYEVDEKTFNKVIRFNYKIENGIKIEQSVTVGMDLERYTSWYNSDISFKNTFFSVIRTDKSSKEWNRFWNKVIKKGSNNSEEQIYYFPNMLYLLSMRNYENYISGETKGLNLLMPQYHRRVEVEDLDKNFWVISQVLDATINALWGPYGLIDVVRQLILKVNQMEEFLGLDNISDIELCYKGDNELYFDMYSRFLLSNLELKLKGESGDRVIKNIFKEQSEISDRNDSTTDGYDSREELFFGIQTNEITPMEEGLQFKGLYDSDLITSEEKVRLSDNNNKYLSLNTVIDAINNCIVGNNDNNVGIGYYDYDIGMAHKEFFSKLDITPDGTISPQDLKNIAQDDIGVSNGKVFSGDEIKRFVKYASAKDYLLSLVKNIPSEDSDAYILLKNLGLIGKENPEEYINNTLFREKKILLEMSADSLDVDNDDEISENEYLMYANNQIDEIRKNLGSMIEAYALQHNNDNIKDFNSMIAKAEAKENSITDWIFKDLDPRQIPDVMITFKVLEKHSDYLNNYFYNSDKKIIDYFNIAYCNMDTEKINIYLPYFKDTGTGPDNINNLDIKGLIKVDLNNLETNAVLNIQKILKLMNFEYSSHLLENISKDKLYIKISSDRNASNENIDKLLRIINYLSGHWRELTVEGVNLSKGVSLPIFKTERDTLWDSKNGAISINDAIKNNEQSTGIEQASIRINDYNKIGLLPSEDTYVYSINPEKIIATKILPESSSNYIQQWFKNPNYVDTAKTFFDVSEDGNINIYDAITIAKNLDYINDAKYNRKMKELMNKIDKNEGHCVNDLENLLSNAYKYEFSSPGSEDSKEKIKNFLFVKKSIGTNTVTITKDIITPTIVLLIKMAALATPSRMINGYKITTKDLKYILQSTKETNYELYGNILIFLYDDDYYELKFDQDGSDGDIQYDDGLYVKVTDGFYGTAQPLIRYDLFYNNKEYYTVSDEEGVLKKKIKYTSSAGGDDTYALFIPRKDLYGGEIIQLRLTEKGKTKKMLDLNKLDYKEGFKSWIEKETINGKEIPRSNLFLSLHNSFADNISQYNHRTTLFFKDTVPEFNSSPNFGDGDNLITGFNTKPFTKVSDWFCNGIECQYFRPTNLKVSEDTVLSENISFHKNLPIKASMICKNEPFVDNSFIFEEGPFDDPKTEEVFYTFARKQAYGAAQRHNLLYYSSPATQEGDMFIHAPSQMLVSPSLRGDESIQAPYWTGATTDIKYAYDVLKNKGDSCKLADIKNMLYKNSRAKERRPLVIEAIWGQRNVDNYIKNKKIKYIVIEREPGSRNQTYGPNCIGFSASKGYLHSKNGLTSLIEKEHWLKECRVNWYKENGELTQYKKTPENGDTTNNFFFPPADAKYGVINLENLWKDTYGKDIFASAFMVRFYSSNLYYTAKDEDGRDNLKKNEINEFTFNSGNNARKPIFKMVYFFGESDSGKSTTEQDFLKGGNK